MRFSVIVTILLFIMQLHVCYSIYVISSNVTYSTITDDSVVEYSIVNNSIINSSDIYGSHIVSSIVESASIESSHVSDCLLTPIFHDGHYVTYRIINATLTGVSSDCELVDDNLGVIIIDSEGSLFTYRADEHDAAPEIADIWDASPEIAILSISDSIVLDDPSLALRASAIDDNLYVTMPDYLDVSWVVSFDSANKTDYHFSHLTGSNLSLLNITIPLGARYAGMNITLHVNDSYGNEAHASVSSVTVRPLTCGNAILEGSEVCEIGDIIACTAADDYAGTRSCSSLCDSWDPCVADESCGDLICNGDEVYSTCHSDCPDMGDDDGDGVPNSMDEVYGNVSEIGHSNSSFVSISVTINGSADLSKDFHGEQAVIIESAPGTPLIEFTFDFTGGNVLDLTSIEVISQTSSTADSFIIIRGLDISSTKTVYMARNNASADRLCIKDEEISSLAEMSSNCSGTQEYSIVCNSTVQSGFSCAIAGNAYVVSGLHHSGIFEYHYPSAPSSDPTPVPVSDPGSSSGGGGFSGKKDHPIKEECKPKWVCSDWEDCKNSFKRRTCDDKNDCGVEPPELEQKCKEKKEADKEVALKAPASDNAKKKEVVLPNPKKTKSFNIQAISGRIASEVKPYKISDIIYNEDLWIIVPLSLILAVVIIAKAGRRKSSVPKP